MRKTAKGMMAAGALLMAAALGFEGTYAYFTYLREVRNRLSVGHNEITITEDYDPPEEITPGEDTSFYKKVQVRNTGPVPCYVRVRLEYSDSHMKQFCTNVLKGNRAPAEEWGAVIEEFSGGAWIFGDDGFYYCRDVLEPGETTGLLLEQVEVSVPEEQSDMVTEFEILVYGESVQTMVHEYGPNGEVTAVEAADYREAWDQILEGLEQKGGA